MEIKYSTKIPPVYQQCKKQFGVSWDKGIVMTYGDTVYSKFGENLSDDLIAHEATHVKQQTAMGKELWWDKYFADKKFRLSQEIEAYKNQMKFARLNYQKKHIDWLYNKLCEDMSRIYGGMCTFEEAQEILK